MDDLGVPPICGNPQLGKLTKESGDVSVYWDFSDKHVICGNLFIQSWICWGICQILPTKQAKHVCLHICLPAKDAKHDDLYKT